MASKPHRKRQAAASMQRVRRRQVFAAMLGVGMVILIIVPLLLGIAIQQRLIVPPQLDVQLGGLQVIASTMHTPDCDRYVTPCPSEPVAQSTQEFYVIWVLTHTGQLVSPKEPWIGIRLLTLRLRNSFHGSRDIVIK
jgi:hypothetical protein